MPWNPSGNLKGPKGDKGDPGSAADVAALIHAAASKAPADADELPLLDSAGSWGLRKFTWSTLKALLQSLFFYRGNILGAVSQAGGVPNGAIIQRGANSNGEYVRFADGTQIAWGKWGLASRTWVANDVYSPGGLLYAAAFISPPEIAVSNESALPHAFFACGEGVRETQVDLMHIRYLSTNTVNMQNTLSVIAIGRWF